MVFAGHADLQHDMEAPIHMELYYWALARSCEFLVLDYELEMARLQEPG
jgi:hypothetical protein